MISSWLTLRDLEYVLAVAKHQHFGRAAKECHVSQPSLSNQIKKIEGYLGASLFERNNRSVSITPAGGVVAEQARIILDEAGKIPSLIGASSSKTFNNLRLGLILTLSPLVPHILPALKKAFPSSTLSLKESLTDDLVTELKTGALDAIIAADTVQDHSLKKVFLFFEPFFLAAPKGHSILTRSKIRTSDLKASDMVLLEEGHCLREQTIDLCSVNRRGNPREYHATNIETLRHLVASGAGYTLLPKLATQGHPMGDMVSYSKFENDKVGRQICLYYRERSEGISSFQKLAETLLKASPRGLDVAR